MKQYLLLLKSSDFNKSGNVWTTDAINLYSNNQYKNYSSTRSPSGLNLIGDRTFVGTEVTSPSTLDGYTPINDNAIYATDVGEIIYEEATPNVQRFIDTSSRIDILSYRHIFTNIPGTISPTFNLQMYESDSASGPWLKSSLSGDTNAIFIRNAKPYAKVELEIYAEEIDINQLGLVFYLEIGIYDPISPAISNSVRNILKRFPSWTALFEDSIADATPSLATPESTGGLFLNALVGENLDYISGQIDLYGINAYINSADIDQLAWCYVSYNVPANINTIVGDDIPLSRVSSLLNFFSSRSTDYVFYYNPVDRQLITMRNFSVLRINDITYGQDPLNIYNDFDEFGARVSLPRLNLESNSNYKKRILDVAKNIPGVSMDAYKKTLRRELDLWRAYGATPDSDYSGATPEILEISDIESSTDYFSEDGKPLPAFKELVENLNIKYPSNLGYVNWGDGVWDYAGTLGEGISRIAAIYDTDTDLPAEYYQPGVGDFDDAKLMIDPVESATVSFSGHIEIGGTKITSTPSYVYSPVDIHYSWYLNYTRTVSDYEAAKRKVATVSYAIGDIGPGGGKIFITPSTAGNSTGKYFEVAPVGVEVQRTWSTGANQSALVSGADGTAIGTGTQNTIDIVAQSGNVSATSAAVYCSDLVSGGYSDWFLPSKDELNEIYVNRVDLNTGFASDLYWSSSEFNANAAWYQAFTAGFQYYDIKSTTGYVRPVRAFISTETYIVDNESVGVALSYEIVTPPHDNYTGTNTFYTNLSYVDRDDMYVGNRFLSTHSASPEFNTIKIFDQDGLTLTNLEFRDKVTNALYYNTDATPASNSISVYDAASVKTTYSVRWNQGTQSYDTIEVAGYRASFNTSPIAYVSNPSPSTSATLTSPNIDYTNANLRIGSTVYVTKQEVKNSDVLTSNIVLNSINDISSSGKENKIISFKDDLLDNIIYPPGATLNYLYIDAATPAIQDLYRSGSYSSHGGYAIDPYTQDSYLVPSSPNIKYGFYAANNTLIGSKDYLTSATVNFSSTTPNYILVDAGTPSSHYPFDKVTNDAFTASTTPSIFSGYIDENNNTYNKINESKNYFYNQDKFLQTIRLNRNSFNLDLEDIYDIDYVKLVTATPNIESYVDNPEILLDSLNTSISENQDILVNINARRSNLNESSYTTGLNTGWLYLDQDQQYIYANPVTENYNGKFFEIELTSIPRFGAPIIVNVANDEATPAVQYRNLVFSDSATPGKTSFYNTENVFGNSGNSLYLAYENLSKISVKDLYTGKTLYNNLSTATNVVSPFSEATPSVQGREYEVVYYVNNAFYVDKDVYSSVKDSYVANLYLSTTPSIISPTPSYEIIYESDYMNSFNSIDLDINQVSNPLEEGYVYIDTSEYEYGSIEAYLSPAHITDSAEDLMYLSIVSYDVNGNLKPNMSFQISGTDIEAEDTQVQTNDNGFATTIIRYTGNTPAVTNEGSILISRITGAATPEYQKTIPFKIYTNNRFHLQVKAAPVRYSVQADGITNVSIVGRVYWKNRPFEHAIGLNWIKERTLLDLFDGTPVNTVTTNADGSFTINGSILAQANTNPGHWFLKIEVNHPTIVRNLLINDGEDLSTNAVTISGDIVYWNEAYDNVQYANEQLPLPNSFIHSKQQNSDLTATPNFVYKYSDSSSIITNNATPNWIPEQWVPLRKFDQYQLKLFGSTPDYITTLENSHPDYEEQ
jgi:hypothetical protein